MLYANGSGTGFGDITTNIVAHNPNEAMLADVNGDGRQDLLYRNNSQVWVRLLTDTGFGAELSTSMAGLANTYVLDYNNDGMADFMQSENGIWVVRVTQTIGTSSVTMRVVSTGLAPADAAATKLIDFNGDGLTDVLERANSNGQVRVLINKGGAFVSAVSLPTYMDRTKWINAIVTDYNGDGRGDLLYSNGSTWQVMLSTGKTTGTDPYVVVQSTTISSDGWDRAPKLMDVTGNGLPDLVVAANSGTWQLRPHNGARPDYLTSVSNGMGVETTFDYKPLTDVSVYTRGTGSNLSGYPAPTMSRGAYLVSQLRQSDGIGGFNATSYLYKYLRVHQRGLGSLGFAEMTTTNVDTNIKTEATFNQDYAAHLQRALITLKTTAVTPNKVLSNTTNTWSVLTANAGTVAERYQRRLDATSIVKKDLNGSFLHREESTYPSYDAFGNILTMESNIYTAEFGGDLSRTTATTNVYTNDASATWLVGLLTKSTVTSNVIYVSLITRQVRFTYDAATGRKTREQILNPANSAVLSTTDYGKDASGVTRVGTFGHNLAVAVSGPDFVTRDSEVSYSSDGRFVLSETNALDQSAAHTYYADTHATSPGLLKDTTAANGVRTDYTYDGFGRTVSTVVFANTPSYKVTTTIDYRWCPAGTWCPATAEYYVASRGADGGETFVFIDKLGREVRKSARSLNGMLVNVDTSYNALGHTAAVTEPYLLDQQSPIANQVLYDVLGRPVQTTQADGRVDTISYNGLTTTANIDTTGKNQQKIELRNVLGDLIAATDNAGNTVSYVSDALGQLILVTPPAVAGLTVAPTTITYDALGRKSAMSDPDKGTWSYTYNGLGELITQKDAKNQVTCMAYDRLGRMVTRVDGYTGSISTTLGQTSNATAGCTNPGAGSEPTSWTFDTATNGVGAIASVAGTNSYAESYTYNTRGLPIKIDRVVGGTTYAINSTYDFLNRIATLTYPGASNRLKVKQVYNNYGYLTDLKNDASGALYYRVGELDEHGNVVSELFGNNLATIRFFNRKNGFLESIQTFDLLNAPTGQNLSVTFDKIGNLTAREDYLRGFHESFGYDNLNRLNSTMADWGNADTQSTTVSYNALGNIRTKTGVGTYQYGSQCSGTQGPHAVCSITGGSIGSKNATYSYDANGNQTSRTIGGVPYTFAYDYENRLTAIAGGSVTASFVYDANGNQVKGTVNGVTTVYIAGVYEWQNGATTLYYEGSAMRRTGYAGDNGVFYLLPSLIHI